MSRSGCKTCPVVRCDTVTYRGSRCKQLRNVHGLGDPKTNADAIREMTDEQLCEFIHRASTGICIIKTTPECYECRKCIMEWLLEPTGKGAKV